MAVGGRLIGMKWIGTGELKFPYLFVFAHLSMSNLFHWASICDGHDDWNFHIANMPPIVNIVSLIKPALVREPSMRILRAFRKPGLRASRGVRWPSG